MDGGGQEVGLGVGRGQHVESQLVVAPLGARVLAGVGLVLRRHDHQPLLDRAVNGDEAVDAGELTGEPVGEREMPARRPDVAPSVSTCETSGSKFGRSVKAAAQHQHAVGDGAGRVEHPVGDRLHGPPAEHLLIVFALDLEVAAPPGDGLRVVVEREIVVRSAPG